MKTDEFLQLLKNRSRTIKIIDRCDLDEYKHYIITTIKAVTATIDFKCEFSNGKCKEYEWLSTRSPSGYKDHPKEDRDRMCCCCNCHHEIGYLKYIVDTDLATYAKHFTHTQGFWSENGCKLPRQLRSSICVFFNCNHDDPVFRKVYDLRDIVMDMERRIERKQQ